MNRPSRKFLAIIATLAAIGGGFAAQRIFAPHPTPLDSAVKVKQKLMGTLWSIEAIPEPGMTATALHTAISEAFAEVARVESVMSEWQPQSPISAINASAGRGPVMVPAELREIIERSNRISSLSHGAFDITWKGLGRLWRWDQDDFVPPSQEQIDAAKVRVDYRKITIAGDAVGLEGADMAMGLGGIAKGYGVDRAVGVLRKHGLKNFFVVGGGDLYVSGLHNGEPWRVGIRHPRRPPNELIARVNLPSGAILTSGDYERYQEVQGVRYHHIIDPRTGKPAWNSQSATIIGPDAETADGLATAVFVLGPADGLKLVQSFPGFEAMVVDREGKISMSAGFTRFASFAPGK